MQNTRTSLSKMLTARLPQAALFSFPPASSTPMLDLRRVERPLPSLETLLSSGGDTRIVRNAQGINKYGCAATPQTSILAYGSSTASTISTRGFAAAMKLRKKLEAASRFNGASTTYAHELNRIRNEIKTLCGLTSLSPDIIFGASGTDLHLFAAQLLCKPDHSIMVIMPEAAETGSGVPAALRGHHFSSCTALGNIVTEGKAVSATSLEISIVKSREENGDLIPASVVDAQIERLVEQSVADGRRVLLTLTDVSKTGLIIPSPACAIGLKQRFGSMVDILVDACQFRLSNETLRAYLQKDFIVAMTGSKFVTGPTFCGALLVPQGMAARLRYCVIPPALAQYSARADWPESWSAHCMLPDVANYGLLVRWEAALAELRAFHALDKNKVSAFVEKFAATIQKKLSADRAFEPLPIAAINRKALGCSNVWDSATTIFPFRLRHVSGALLDKNAMTLVYEQLRTEHCQLGQPVIGGALRLCLDMRLIVAALSAKGCGEEAVIADALRVLDKAAMVARSII